MKNYKKYIFFIVFILCSTIVNAQTTYTNGCYVASEGRAYLLISGVCRYGLQVCDPVVSSNYIVLTRVTATACTTCSFTGSPAKAGVVVDFAVFPCPLDNYLFGLLIPIGFLGFQYLRRTA